MTGSPLARLLGYGAINRVVAEGVAAGLGGPAVVAAVLVSRERVEPPPGLPAGCLVTTDAAAFHAAGWDLCVEAAGQPAVRAEAARCLEAGRDFLVTSIGSCYNPYLSLHLAVIGTGYSASTAM